MMHIKQLLIYANSSHMIGSGHIMRQLAIAHTAKLKGFSVTFIYQKCTDALLDKVKKNGFSIEKMNSPFFSPLILKYQAKALIIDDYSLSEQQTNELSQEAIPIIHFDDHVKSYANEADIVINSAEHIVTSDYQTSARHIKFLLGSNYRLIRQEFIFQTQNLPEFHNRQRLLISLGGTDTLALSLPLIKSLLTINSNLPIDLIMGNTSDHAIKEISSFISNFDNVKLHIALSDMSALMAQASMAISTAGGTLYELASMGVPTIGLCVVDNQLPALQSRVNNTYYICYDMRPEYASDSLKELSLLCIDLWQNKTKRSSMAKHALQAIDGLGSKRVMMEIEKLIDNNIR